jgi:hypothetical protein
MAKLVKFARGEPGFYERSNVVEDFGSQPAGYPHFFDFVGSLE